MIKVNRKFKQIAKEIDVAGGDLWVVGGAIRDVLMARRYKDLDFMVSGITTERAKEIFTPFCSEPVEHVISNAPVFMAKIHGIAYEIAMARVEVDTKPGKNGFEFISHPGLTVYDDLARRDFTINAMAWHVLGRFLVDPHKGQQDVQLRVLRAVSPKFVESPERVMRFVQQAARFDFNLDPETVELCKSMKKDFHTIAIEQIWRHMKKFIVNAVAPRRGIDVLVATGWNEFFPEVEKADVSMMKGDVVEFLVAMVKDMEQPTRFLERIGCPPKIAKKVGVLATVSPPDLSDESARRLNVAVSKVGFSIRQFVELRPEHKAILVVAEKLNIADESIKPIVTGKVLLAQGVRPGPEMGRLIREAFEQQMKGAL